LPQLPEAECESIWHRTDRRGQPGPTESRGSLGGKAWYAAKKGFGGYVEDGRVDGLYTPGVLLPADEASIELSMRIRYSVEDCRPTLGYELGCPVSNWDAVSVRVRTSALGLPGLQGEWGAWETLEGTPGYGPAGTYGFAVAAAQCGVKGWCGASDAWHTARFDLTQHGGRKLQVGIFLATDPAQNSLQAEASTPGAGPQELYGALLDDILIRTGNSNSGTGTILFWDNADDAVGMLAPIPQEGPLGAASPSGERLCLLPQNASNLGRSSVVSLRVSCYNGYTKADEASGKRNVANSSIGDLLRDYAVVQRNTDGTVRLAVRHPPPLGLVMRAPSLSRLSESVPELEVTQPLTLAQIRGEESVLVDLSTVEDDMWKQRGMAGQLFLEASLTVLPDLTPQLVWKSTSMGIGEVTVHLGFDKSPAPTAAPGVPGTSAVDMQLETKGFTFIVAKSRKDLIRLDALAPARVSRWAAVFVGVAAVAILGLCGGRARRACKEKLH